MLALSLLAAVLAPVGVLNASAAPARDALGDATVIAIIDSGFSPYHYDFLASKMPAEARGLPLTKAPHTWLPGFPKPDSFESYASLPLTLPRNETDEMAKLYAKDEKAWADVKHSTAKKVNYRWIPGTKVIGALSFGPEADDRALDKGNAAMFGYGDPIYGTGGAEHGMGSASVSVGNLNGTCPQCLLVFIQYTSHTSAERALTWAMKQPWIDAVSNSYGISTGYAVRDRIYNGTDVVTQKAASERGQTIFFSAGNGLEGGFIVPNQTFLSSQEGPDWVVTVGATNTKDKNHIGTGKPVDVAGIGSLYPSAYESTNATNGNTFSGTSNAAPQVAGTYAQALWQLRRALPGVSRLQAGGVIASGPAVRCRGCELGDGRLTAQELRQRLFLGAKHTDGSYSLAGQGEGPPIADTRWANEGHGTFRGRLDDKTNGLQKEIARIVGPALGKTAAMTRPAGEVEWFRVDSWCRQHIWGSWAGGYYRSASATPLPAADPAAWPTRTAIQQVCPALMPPPPPIY